MPSRRNLLRAAGAALAGLGLTADATAGLRAGAFAMDITPTSFPVIINGTLRGIVTRQEVAHALAAGSELLPERPVVCLATQSLREVEPRMLESSAGLFLVADTEGGPITGVFTLHDLLRAQAALLE